MRSIKTLVLLLYFAACSLIFAQSRHHGLAVDRNQEMAITLRDETPDTSRISAKRNLGSRTNALGPGKFLMISWYDYSSRGGVCTNIVDYGDGTLAVGRMATEDTLLFDRGTFWSYFDGASWSPMTKVEPFGPRNRSNLSALADGRSVTVSHLASESLEFNRDAMKGAADWTRYMIRSTLHSTIFAPRLAIDRADNIFICSTKIDFITGALPGKELAVSYDEGRSFSFYLLLADTSAYVPQFLLDDQSIDSFEDKIAMAVAELGGNIHLWETMDNGREWIYRNLTNYPRDIPVGSEANRPWHTCEVIYDQYGTLHIFWESVLATQDTAGTEIELFHNRDAGIQHWSEITGIRQVVAWSDIPDAGLESDDLLFAAGAPFDQINANNTLVAQPQAGVDAGGYLYLLFSAFRPLDIDMDSSHFTDVYVIGSDDEGATWTGPVNVTDTPQSEDLWASLADDVSDSLRFVYQSDDNTGNGIQGGGETPTTILYHAFDKAMVFENSVRFRVNMTCELPELEPGEIVGIRGSIPPLSWLETIPMTDTDGVFTAPVDFSGASPGTEIEYKFVHHPLPLNNKNVTWEGGALPADHRTFTLATGPQAPPEVLWNDVECRRHLVRFQVDMGCEFCDIAPEEIIGVRGSVAPLSWSASFPMSDLDGDSIFTADVDFFGTAAGTEIEYKFAHHPPPLENNENVTWEDTVGVGSNGNRVFTLAGGSQPLPVERWNNLYCVEIKVVAQVNCPARAYPGCAISVPVTIDLTCTNPLQLMNAYSAQLNWDPNLLDYVGISGGDPPFDAPVIFINEAAGQLIFVQIASTGIGGIVEVANIEFEVLGTVGSETFLDLDISDIHAGPPSQSLLPYTTVNDCSVAIADGCLLGDVTNDDAMTIFDALIIASHAVEQHIPGEFWKRIQQGCGDVTLDQATTIFDALVIATFAVGLPVEPFSVGEPLCP